MDDMQKADKVTLCLTKLARQYKDEALDPNTQQQRVVFANRNAVMLQEAANTLSPESKAKLYDILTSN